MLIWLMGLRFDCMDELRDGMACNYFKRVTFFSIETSFRDSLSQNKIISSLSTI